MTAMQVTSEDFRSGATQQEGYTRSTSRGLSMLDPQLTDLIQDLETDGRETSLKKQMTFLRNGSSVMNRHTVVDLTREFDPFMEDGFTGDLSMTREKKQDLALTVQPMEVTEQSSVVVKPTFESYLHFTQESSSMDQEEEGQFSQKRKSDVMDEVRNVMMTADDILQQMPSLPTRKKRSKRGGGQSRMSRFCHVCTRSSSTVNVHPCGNFFRSGSCRKVVCEKCFQR